QEDVRVPPNFGGGPMSSSCHDLLVAWGRDGVGDVGVEGLAESWLHRDGVEHALWSPLTSVPTPASVPWNGVASGASRSARTTGLPHRRRSRGHAIDAGGALVVR